MARAPSQAPRIVIAPADALADEPVRIRIHGCAPRAQITLRATAWDDFGREWMSWAAFETDADGSVDVGSQAPVAGSYTTADAMGFLWSMRLDPSKRQDVSLFAMIDLEPMTITLTGIAEGNQFGSASLTRRFLSHSVRRSSVRERGLVGTLFMPVGEGVYPGVLVLGGSGGGLREHQAALLAARGVAALALAYFAYETLPERLANIPLEYFETALAWLGAQQGIRADRLAVLGASRGAELALLLGAASSHVRAVVGYAPSSVIWGATGSDEPAWTYHGVPVPRMPNRVTPEQSAAIFTCEPYSPLPWYALNLDDEAARAVAAIPVERIAGPVLLISGEDDQIWPASRMAKMVMERRRALGQLYPDAHLSYSGVGHLVWPFSSPYLPTTVTARSNSAVGGVLEYGGMPADIARAATHSWPRVLTFLAASLTP